MVDDQLELPPLLARSRRDVLDLAEGDGRQEHLVADAPAFEDDSILELAPQSTGQRRDHDDTLIGARRPGARIRRAPARARRPRGSASGATLTSGTGGPR